MKVTNLNRYGTLIVLMAMVLCVGLLVSMVKRESDKNKARMATFKTQLKDVSGDVKVFKHAMPEAFVVEEPQK